MGGFTVGDPGRAIELCGLAEEPTNRAYCIEGAVQNRFWEVSGADEALSMCAMSADQGDRFACNQTIVFRAQELYETQEAFSAFCNRVEESFRAWCLSKEITQVGSESPIEAPFDRATVIHSRSITPVPLSRMRVDSLTLRS